MNTALILLGIALVWTTGFFFGSWVTGYLNKSKDYSNLVIDLIQEHLANDDDYRGFTTRTHLYNWLDKRRFEIREDLLDD